MFSRVLISASILVVFLSQATFGQEEGYQCQSNCYYTPETQCINGTCVCDDPSFQHYPEHYQCALPVGSSCTDESRCSSSASCTPDGNPSFPRICWNGLYRQCYRESDCNPNEHLACTGGVCRCNNPITQMDFGYGKCQVKTYSKGCSVDGVSKPKCGDKNAECVGDEDEEGVSVCQCKPGTKFLNGICEPSPVGIFCTMYECASGLTCKNNKCQCQDSEMVYDQENKVCQIPVGERCDADDVTGGYYQAKICQAGSQCLEDRASRIRICKCEKPKAYSTDPETGLMACV